MTFLMLVLLFSKAMKEKFSIILADLMAITVVFVLFGDKDQSQDISGSHPHYFYFGYNFLVPSLHNGYISGTLFIVLLAFYLIIEIFPPSKLCSRRTGIYSTFKST